MSRIRLAKLDEDYPKDVTGIQSAVLNHGYECSRKQAEQLWLEYSDSMCAGWIYVEGRSEDNIWEQVEPFIESRW